MPPIARLHWHDPVRIVVTPHRRLSLDGDLARVPVSRGMYLFGHRSSRAMTPLYVGLASRSIRRRLTEHLKSPRMLAGLSAALGGDCLFFFAELDPGDLEFAKRHLPSYETALIDAAVRFGGGNLNTRRRTAPPGQRTEKCVFINTGNCDAWRPWSATRVTTALLPERRPRGWRTELPAS